MQEMKSVGKGNTAEVFELGQVVSGAELISEMSGTITIEIYSGQ